MRRLRRLRCTAMSLFTQQSCQPFFQPQWPNGAMGTEAVAEADVKLPPEAFGSDGRRHVRVVRPVPIRLQPIYVHDLPCTGYPGPLRIPLCGAVTCRHLPCYTWHLTNPPLQLQLPMHHKGAGLSIVTSSGSEPSEPTPPVSPMQATVTTPGGTVTLYRWSDGPDGDDGDEKPEVIQLTSRSDDVDLVIDTMAGAPEQPSRRNRGPSRTSGISGKATRAIKATRTVHGGHGGTRRPRKTKAGSSVGKHQSEGRRRRVTQVMVVSGPS